MDFITEQNFIPLTNWSMSDDEADGYQSDNIDQEIEHQLYSFIHHDTCDKKSISNIPSDINHKFSFDNNSNSNEVINSNDKKDSTCFTMSLTLKNLNCLSNVNHEKVNNFINLEKTIKKNSKPLNKNYLISHFISNSNLVTSSEEKANKEESDEDDCLKSKKMKIDVNDKQFLGRYYRTSKFCTHCKKYGNHAVKLCSLVKKNVCYFCCALDHIGPNCPNRYCNKCMDFHQLKNCNSNYHNSICQVCNLYGHVARYCPNNWRKFFNITQFGVDPNSSQLKIKILKNKRKFCGNCGLEQHFTFECSTFFKENNFIPNSPYVYETRSKYLTNQESNSTKKFNSNYLKKKLSNKKCKAQTNKKFKVEIEKKHLELKKAEIRANKKAKNERVKEIRKLLKKSKKAEKLKKKKKKKFAKKTKRKIIKS